MALRARLTPPREEATSWPYHVVTFRSLPASMLCRGERRMEAGGFLASGFATRMAIQAKPSGWAPLARLAQVWQPPRLEGIQVSPQFGTPFLTATQVFDRHPAPRKWLSLEQTPHAARRFVRPGTILVTCSGTVGRATVARDSLDRVLVTHDLLRIEPKAEDQWGWLYAYLRSQTIIGLMQAAHYGHIVKHLEVSHLDEIPVVEIEQRRRPRFNELVRRILDDRNKAEALLACAQRRLSSALGLEASTESGAVYSRARCSELASGRRRMEGAFYAERVRSLLKLLTAYGRRVDGLGELTHRVWWMTRFSREFGEGGVPYMSADDLFSISQITEKRVFTDLVPDHKDFYVEEGWLLMACSGQVYGLNGSVLLTTKRDEGYFFSHDLIRIAPRTDAVRPGYLHAYLSHPGIGRLLTERAAYGSSIPHIDPVDVQAVPIARLSADVEAEIADYAEEAARLYAQAAEVERQVATEADLIVRAFVGANGATRW